jgi:hypothetical protein
METQENNPTEKIMIQRDNPTGKTMMGENPKANLGG